MTQLTRRTFLSASLINGGGFMLASLATVLWYFMVVKGYHGNASGQLLLAISVAGLINCLDFGVSMGLVRIFSLGEERSSVHSQRDYFQAALWITSAVEITVGIVAVWIWKTLSFPDLPLSAYFSIVVFALTTQIVLFCVSAFKGLCNFKSANLVSTGSTLAVYGLGVVSVASGASVWNVFLTMTCVQSLSAGAALFYVNAELAKNQPKQATALKTLLLAYRDLFQPSIRFFPQMFAGIFFMHAQRFIIARYVGLDSVGVISFAYSIATRLHAVVNAFLEVIFPMARKLQAQGINPVVFCAKLGLQSAVVYLLVASAVTFVANLMMPGIFSTLFGYSIGVMFAVGSMPAFHYLNGNGDSAKVSFCSLLSPLVFFVIAMLLHDSFTADKKMLLPVAYSGAMAIMLIHASMLVRQYATRTSIPDLSADASFSKKAS